MRQGSTTSNLTNRMDGHAVNYVGGIWEMIPSLCTPVSEIAVNTPGFKVRYVNCLDIRAPHKVVLLQHQLPCLQHAE